MPIYQVVGIRRFNYRSKKGFEYPAVNLYCTWKDDNTDGYRTESFFFKEDGLPNLTLGCKVRIYYNRYGRSDYIELVNN